MSEQPKLVFGDNTTIIINNSSFTIGRSLSCDHIIESLGVSRFHCTIKRVNNRWILFDRSTNGTTVNTTLCKFNENVELNHGDVIKLGPENATFVFTHPETSSAKQVPHGSESGDSDDITSHFEPLGTILDMQFKVIDEIVGSADDDSSNTDNEPQKPPDIKPEHMDSELTCSICSELFVKAVTLNCSHTYCQYCISEWRKNKSTCPICRKDIQTVSSTLVLDNFIAKFVGSQSEDVQAARKEVIKYREELMQDVASGSSAGPTGAEVIEVSEDSFEDYSSDDEEFDEFGIHDYDFDYDDDRYGQSRRPYYGGYGRCYVCQETGHWANGCPFK